jgi:catechol 2,3-dioxygenase-like lactoylglutathione lyase family enzyme
VEGGGRETTTAAERRWHNVFCPENETRGVRVFAIEHLSPAEALPRAVAVEAPEASVVGCDHVVISTDDPDASKALYGEKLGLRLALDRTFENWRVRLLFFRIAGITVELAGGLDADNDPTGTDTLWGLSYRVANVEAIRERLAGDGFEVSEVRKGRRPGTRVCTVRRETHGVATLLIGPDGST